MAVVPDTGWGVIEWAITGLATVLSILAGLLWRIGTRVGSVMTRLEAVEMKQEKTDSRVESLSNGHHSIEKSIAALPDQIMQRIDKRFDDLNLRIDGVVDRR